MTSSDLNPTQGPAAATGVQLGARVYRSDIDGLRALAVVPVVLFHAGVASISGGFVGVDVFFVISGYLIGAHIFSDVASGKFSLLAFYERRARRILPALVFMVTTVSVVATLMLTPDDLIDYGESLVGVATFSSNFAFWLQSGYFAQAATMKPLLHTWSLGVEEQFYLLFPLFILALARAPQTVKLLAIGLLAAVSLVVSAWGVQHDPTATFYLPFGRAWELLLGAGLAATRIPHLSRWLQEAVGWSGIAAIGLSMALLTDASPFPGLLALPACLGAAAIIVAGMEQRALASAALGMTPLRAVGLVSYSLYLWHWPIIVLARYQLLRSPSGWEILGLIACATAAAMGSWAFVERPFRRSVLPRRKALGLSAGALVLIAVLGMTLVLGKGLPQRFPGYHREADLKGTQVPGCFMEVSQSFNVWSQSNCHLTEAREKAPVFLWGDSHANHLVDGIRALAGKSDVLMYSSAGCVPAMNVHDNTRPNCSANNERALRLIDEIRPRRVVLAASWRYGLRRGVTNYGDIDALVRAIRAKGVDVYVIGQGAVLISHDPAFLAYRLKQRGITDFSTPSEPVDQINARLHKIAGDGHFLDPSLTFCKALECRIVQNGKLMFADGSHLTKAGSVKVVSASQEAFR